MNPSFLSRPLSGAQRIVAVPWTNTSPLRLQSVRLYALVVYGSPHRLFKCTCHIIPSWTIFQSYTQASLLLKSYSFRKHVLLRIHFIFIELDTKVINNNNFNRGNRPYSKLSLHVINSHSNGHHASPRLTILYHLPQVPISPAKRFWGTLCGLYSAFGYRLVPGNEGFRRTPGMRRIQEVRGNGTRTGLSASNNIWQLLR